MEVSRMAQNPQNQTTLNLAATQVYYKNLEIKKKVTRNVLQVFSEIVGANLWHKILINLAG